MVMENKDLVQTLKEKSFPPEQKWLVDISTAHFGIHQRINNLLEELARLFKEFTPNEFIGLFFDCFLNNTFSVFN